MTLAVRQFRDRSISLLPGNVKLNTGFAKLLDSTSLDCDPWWGDGAQPEEGAQFPVHQIELAGSLDRIDDLRAVQEEMSEYVVTLRGEPVAVLRPLTEEEAQRLRLERGAGLVTVRTP